MFAFTDVNKATIVNKDTIAELYNVIVQLIVFNKLSSL